MTKPKAPPKLSVVGARSDDPPPPKHLSADARGWWKQVCADYRLEPHHLRLLELACQSWDRGQEARKALADYGSLTFTTGTGGLAVHPGVGIERDARTAFARLLRELDLDFAGAPGDRRPPPLISNRR